MRSDIHNSITRTVKNAYLLVKSQETHLACILVDSFYTKYNVNITKSQLKYNSKHNLLFTYEGHLYQLKSKIDLMTTYVKHLTWKKAFGILHLLCVQMLESEVEPILLSHFAWLEKVSEN